MSVTITFAALIADRIGGINRVEVAGSTVEEAMRDLSRRYPQLAPIIWEPSGAINDFLVFFVNRRDVRELRGLDTEVVSSDEIMVLGAAEGG